MRHADYDIILMDCQMPILDGYATTCRIRQREHTLADAAGTNPPVYIIAMTAHAMEGDRQRCLAAGMDDYLSKPVEETELQAALERWQHLRSTRKSRSLGVTSAATPPATRSETKVPEGETIQPKGPETPTVDIKRLVNLTRGEPKKLRIFIGLYLEETEKHLQNLALALEKRETAQVEYLAHKCAGSSLTCGVTEIVPPLRELERQGRAGALGQTEPLFAQVRREFNSAQSFFAQYLRTLDKPAKEAPPIVTAA
jgi:CheY-like chemotaxis protein/HPt (histidine-containing phosphotransfer) domain-containing protein